MSDVQPNDTKQDEVVCPYCGSTEWFETGDECYLAVGQQPPNKYGSGWLTDLRYYICKKCKHLRLKSVFQDFEF